MKRRSIITILSCSLILCSCDGLEDVGTQIKDALLPPETIAVTREVTTDAETESTSECLPTKSKQTENTDVTEDVTTTSEYVPATLDTEMYPFYAALGNDARSAYYDILEGVENCESRIILHIPLPVEQVKNLGLYIEYDNPGLFWFEGTFTYNYTDGYVTSIVPDYNDLAQNLDLYKAQIEAVTEPIIAVAATMTPIEAEKYVHDQLAVQLSYAHGDYDQNIYSALVQKQTVCAGYTKAMQYILQKLGIPTYYCTGKSSDDGTWERHSWNIVKLLDEYVNVDVTWDDDYNDPEKNFSSVVYSYYNLTDEEIGADHQRDEYGSMLPACSGTQFSYENYYGHGWLYDQNQYLEVTYSEPVTSLEEYYSVCLNFMESSGTGEHTLKILLDGDALAETINGLAFDAHREGYVDAAASALGLNGWSCNLSMSFSNLSRKDGYYYLVQYITLN